MNKQKNKNIIIVLLAFIIIILVTIIILFATNTISLGYSPNNDNLSKDTDNLQNEKNNNNIEENEKNFNEDDFIRKNKITLIEEPNCTGNPSSLIATIEANGSISISQNDGAAIVEPGNAKYLYSVDKLACDFITLYYITDNNELYSIDNPRSDVDQIATKVTNSEVIEFLGIEHDGNKHYLKVLLKDNTVQYINYLATSE